MLKIITTCDFCNKKIFRHASRIKEYKNKFCSKECHYKFMAKKSADFCIGKKFNFLKVVDVVFNKKNHKAFAKCVCDCGRKHVVLLASIKNGKTKSCGCRSGKSQKEKFFENLDKNGPNNTWIWNGPLNKKGYGYTSTGEYAHRFSWKLKFGDIPNNLHVLHKNDIPRDVNPDNLFLGTNLDNIKDMNEKGRNAKGETNGHSKLEKQSVLDIRNMWKNGSDQIDIAKKHNISQCNVSRIVNRKTWKHI